MVTFYSGQTDYIDRLNELATANEVVGTLGALDQAQAAAQAASNSAVAADASASNASQANANFETKYLGSKSSPPTLDNQGGALIDGAIYWDSVLNGGCLRVRHSGVWVTIPTNVASEISFTPIGSVSSSNVQDAIAELANEKAPLRLVSTTISSSSYTAVNSSVNSVILCNTSSNNIQVDLPTAVNNLTIYHIKKVSVGNTLTIEPFASETVEGGTNIVISEIYETVTLVSDGSNWIVV